MRLWCGRRMTERVRGVARQRRRDVRREASGGTYSNTTVAFPLFGSRDLLTKRSISVVFAAVRLPICTSFNFEILVFEN